MAQHLVVGDIAALLIVLGLTGPLLQPLLAIKAIDRLRVLTHPLIALPLWAASLYIWHIPALYQAALSNEAVHALQHACFIGFGILMWMPLVGPLPVPSWFGIGPKLGYVDRRPLRRARRWATSSCGRTASSIPTTPRARPSSTSRRWPTRARRA